MADAVTGYLQWTGNCRRLRKVSKSSHWQKGNEDMEEEYSRRHGIGMLLSKTGVAVAISILFVVPVPGFLLHISSGYLVIPVAITFGPPLVVVAICFCSRWSPPFRILWCLLLAVASLCGGYTTVACVCSVFEASHRFCAAWCYLVPASAVVGVWGGPTLLNLALLVFFSPSKLEEPSARRSQPG